MPGPQPQWGWGLWCGVQRASPQGRGEGAVLPRVNPQVPPACCSCLRRHTLVPPQVWAALSAGLGWATKLQAVDRIHWGAGNFSFSSPPSLRSLPLQGVISTWPFLLQLSCPGGQVWVCEAKEMYCALGRQTQPGSPDTRTQLTNHSQTTNSVPWPLVTGDRGGKETWPACPRPQAKTGGGGLLARA